MSYYARQDQKEDIAMEKNTTQEKQQASQEFEQLLRKLAAGAGAGGTAKSMIVGGVSKDGEFIVGKRGMRLVRGGQGDTYHVELTAKSIEEAIEQGEDVARARLLDEMDDPFNYDTDSVVPPPWPFATLQGLMVENTWHNACVETKASDYAYNRPRLFLRNGAKELASEQELREAKEEVEAFLKTCYDNKPIEDLLKELAVELESLGCAAFEVRRDSKGFIRALTMVSFADVRILTRRFAEQTDAKYLQKKFDRKVYYRGFNDTVEYTDKNGDVFYPSAATDSMFPSLDARESHIRLKDGYVDYRNAEETADPEFAANELFILTRSPFTKSRVYGTPSGISAYNAMLAQMKIDAYNLAFFTAQGVPQYAVVFRGLTEPRGSDVNDATSVDDSEVEEMTPSDIVQLKETIKEYFKKEVKAGNRSILVLTLTGNAEVEFVPLSTEALDASFEQYEQRCRDKIRVAHRVPSAALGIDVTNTGLGGTKDEIQMRRYRDHIVAPGQRMMENIANVIIRCGLLIPYYDFKFVPMALEEETKSREFHLTEFERGAITVNEYRESRGWPRLEGEQGDVLILRSTNLTMITTNPDSVARRIQDSISYEKHLRNLLTGSADLDDMDATEEDLYQYANGEG